MTRVSVGECVWCGRYGPLEDDHVPPRSFFPRPRPSDLITVPSCRTCNRGWARDGDYARLAIVMNATVEAHPSAAAVATTAQRGLARPQQAGFTRAFLEAVRPTPTLRDGRASITDGSTLMVDAHRMHRFLARVVQGLYYNRTGVRLPDSHEAICFWLGAIASNADLSPAVFAIAERLSSLPPTVVGDGAFCFRFALEPSMPYVSFWLLHFYEGLAFIGLTQPRGGA